MVYPCITKVVMLVSEKLSPLTFRITPEMERRINQLVEKKYFKNKAELIREAVENFLLNEKLIAESFTSQN